MKRICAFLATAVLCLSVITISYAAAPSFAATKWCTPPTGFGGGSRVIPSDTIVSYSDLRDYRIAVNQWLSEGQYSGFHGTASLTYTGSFYFIQLVQDGNVYWLCNSSGGRYRTEAESSTGDSSTTTVPSTTAPSASKNEGTDRDSTTVTDPTTPSDSTTELNALNRLIKLTVTQIKSIQGVWRTNINMYNIQVKLRRLMWDTIDGINNVTTGIYKQVDLLTGYLPRLDDIYNRLFNIQSASWASVDVENRIYSGVAGIGSRLDGVITNGEVQINTTPLEARLDKLISMYSKVNAVVLDTAAINGSQINDAVGGELEDVMFWGSSLKSGGQFVYADPLTYTLNDVQTTVVNVPLRGMVLGTSIPSTIDDTDEVLMAGVWQGPNGKYYVSDTYNAVTGEYVQRLRSITYDGSEGWKMTAKSDGMNMFWYRDKFIEDVSGGRDAMASASWLGYKNYDSTFYNQANAAAASKNKFTLAGQAFRIIVSSDDYPDVASWTSYLSANPLTFFYVLSAPTDSGAAVDLPVVTMLDPVAIAIPEGDSTISAFRARITGKYETYDSYTQTADIITAINGLHGSGIGGDLTAVTSRLDLILAELQNSSGSASCEHTYTQHMEQEADCTLPGLMISTCSKCGDSYSEIVDPLGHDWVVSSHVDAVTDPDTGEETASAYDVYTCSRCERTYEDHTGDGAPDEDYSDTSISKLVVKVFSKLGTFAGKLIGFFVHLLDKALASVDNVISKFNDYTAQISSFGGSYTTWLTGFWGIIPAELQIALTFSVICMALGAVGKKLLFS